jgi:hypothetical protein
VGASPTRQPLQPEAIGAVIEACLFGDARTLRGSPAHQATDGDALSKWIYGEHRVPHRQYNKLMTPNKEVRIWHHEQRIGFCGRKGRVISSSFSVLAVGNREPTLLKERHQAATPSLSTPHAHSFFLYVKLLTQWLCCPRLK